MAKTLKEIAIELLEKYEASENVAICEYSTNINKDIDLLEKEVKKYRRMIENADRKTENSSEKPNNCELQKDCLTCRYNSDEWDSPKCDGCSKAHNNYKPQTERGE